MLKVDEGDGYAFDLDYCKGCGICVQECPCGAIVMIPEGGLRRCHRPSVRRWTGRVCASVAPMRRLICAAVLLALASTVDRGARRRREAQGPGARQARAAEGLRVVPDLVAYGRRYAVSPGVANGVPPRAVEQVRGAARCDAAQRHDDRDDRARPPRRRRPSAGDTAADSFSGTNVQEQGVDEPDVVKTDGKRVFVLAGAKLLALRRHRRHAEAARLAHARGQPAGPAAAR